MASQNRNVHVVYDGMQWAVAVEGVGRIEDSLDLTKAIAVATAIALEGRVLLYVHDKQGCVAKRMDFSIPAILESQNGRELDDKEKKSMRVRSRAGAL